eukprot:COSAG01_NODE_6125_length_3838_cov_1.407328_3_plen_147_part_00
MAHGHQSVYCSTADDSDCNLPFSPAWSFRQFLEPIFHEFGVDIWINGHEHSYERSYPVYKSKSDRSNVAPKATIYIVTGAAGCSEMHEGVPTASHNTGLCCAPSLPLCLSLSLSLALSLCVCARARVRVCVLCCAVLCCECAVSVL